MSLAILQEMPGAVAAEIVEAAQFAIPIADHEDPPAHDLACDVIAWGGDRRSRAQELPFPGEDRLAFALEDIGTVIPIGRQPKDGRRLQR